MGDTGLWYVPTGEVLPDKRWSGSAYRVNFDDNQGFTDVSNWPVTFGDRAQGPGGDLRVVRGGEPDRPGHPAAVHADGVVGGGGGRGAAESAGAAGVEREQQLGDFWVGAKVNLTSQWRQQPVALAVRGMVKLPTGDTDSGAGTGKADFALDAIVSKEINERVEVSGYGGFIVRGSPDEVETTNAFRWGLGAGFPSRKALRFTAELTGRRIRTARWRPSRC